MRFSLTFAEFAGPSWLDLKLRSCLQAFEVSSAQMDLKQQMEN